MIFRVIGAVIFAIGVVINFGYAPILKNLFKVTEPTDSQVVKTKLTGFGLAVVGALIILFSRIDRL